MLRKYKNPRFNLQTPLNIQFQISGTVELGVDADAIPSRALFDAGVIEREVQWH